MKLEYKWVVLINTTIGMLMASINQTIVLISLPAIFSGLHVDPLGPGQSTLLLWTLMGYSAVTTVLRPGTRESMSVPFGAYLGQRGAFGHSRSGP